MQSKASTVAEYLAALPDDRRAAIESIRKVILKNLDKDYEEGMQYGVIGYYVPHKLFPAGYHCDPKQPLPFAALASQKNYMSLYMMGVYCGCGDDSTDITPDARWFRDAWTKAGKKLDMGKACVRFKKLDDVPLDVVGEAIKRIPAKLYIERYLNVLSRTKSGAKAAKKTAVAKPVPKAQPKIVRKTAAAKVAKKKS
ncbi:MAG: DUF1801 domain-containing protein [Usitatibacteraceae bacterium]